MTERRYLKWYNKVGYGSGDIAGNVVYALLSAFVLIYLTDTVGLNSGIIGTLMMLSKIFDGFTDVFFGSMIDKTKSKMGKARPWMLWGYVGNAILLAAIFAIPSGIGETAQYAYFFITYTLLNAVFYTANNIAYSALTALVTKNGHERVQMGSIRFIFAFSTSMLIQYFTVDLVGKFGGGAIGWRKVAFIYAVIGLIVNTLSVLSVKELSAEELAESDEEEYGASEWEEKNSVAKKPVEEKLSFGESASLLLHNRFYLIICGVYILTQVISALTAMGIYFMTYVLGDANLLGKFSIAMNMPIIIGLLLTPMLVKRLNGMYHLNLAGYAMATGFRILLILASFAQNIPLMLLFTALAYIGTSPLSGDLNALIAACSDYTWNTTGKRIDGTMYSCTSLGVKIGGGVGVSLGGWLLQAGGYVNNAAVQSQSCIAMLNFMYLWLPLILTALVTILLSRLTVEKCNRELTV